MENRVFMGLAALCLASVSLLSGCNMANSADGGSDSSSNLAEPTAAVSVVSSTPEANSSGYYNERSTLTVNASAVGSLGSSVTCSISFDYKSAVATDFSNLQTVSGCGAKDFNLYSGAGVYRVKLTATDANSKVAEDQKFVIAIPTAISDTPYLSANFNFTTSTDLANLFDVYLDATSSTKGETGDIVSYTWQIRLKQDDGNESLVSTVGPNISPVTTVTVNQDGIYVVRLTVVDAGSQTATTEKMFSVDTANTLVADFSATISGTAPVNIGVDASSSTVAAGVNHYVWEVSTVGAETDAVIYRLTVESATTVLPITSAGTYLITLKVIDNLGNEHQISRVVTVS
ncbi:hypothetical protein QCB45_00265 [Thiomicrorhabdus sp. ZW0627]|uniref:hypothetical protein n=1 Tax=Thiomicrorhabdus sp. ZW0627 TaxID=3039774 RepID=UPI0024369B2E|nr:hypothetical protein [Thiomicrorhabdus sp. ZW0627]MDG6772762.1 hypothetical protein [Thiomicrorhabdus sp. ZW0627]